MTPFVRRLSALLVLAVAGGSSLATSPSRSGPEVSGALAGAIELTADDPVAFQEVVLELEHAPVRGPGLVGDFPPIFGEVAVSTHGDPAAAGENEVTVRPFAVQVNGRPTAVKFHGIDEEWSFDPFESCPSAGRCDVRFVMAFEWQHVRHGATAGARWNVRARAVFRTEDALPSGALARLRKGEEVRFPDGSTGVVASGTGVLAPDVGGERVEQKVRVVLDGGAFPRDRGVPPLLGLLRFRARVVEPSGQRLPVAVRLIASTGAELPEPSVGVALLWLDEERERLAAISAFDSCAPGRDCDMHYVVVSFVALGTESYRGDAGRRVEWAVDVELRYRDGRAAPDGAARVEVGS